MIIARLRRLDQRRVVGEARSVDPGRVTEVIAAMTDAMVWAAITTTGGDGSSNAKASEELDMGTS